MKLLTDKGAGEAKLFVGIKSKESEIDEFFSFAEGYTYRFDKTNMLEYLHQVKMEFVFQNMNQYKSANLEKWNDIYRKIAAMPKADFIVHLTKFTDASRYYVRADEELFKKLFRKMVIPKLTDLFIQKDDMTKEIVMFLRVNYNFVKNGIEIEDEDPEERNKRLFKHWMGLQVKPENDSDAGKPYSESTIGQYVADISNVELPMVPGKSVFYTTNIGDVESIIESLDAAENKYVAQLSAIKKYAEFLTTLVSEEDCEEIFLHSLFGIHIKEKNTALSENNPHICIGWSDLGDLSEIKDKNDLAILYDAHFEKNNRGRGQDIGQIWRFINDVKEGDYVIFAENSVFHIGRIESDYYFDKTVYEGQSNDYKNTRKVRWLKKNISRSVLSSDLHNSLKTAMSIWGLNDYKSAVSDLLRGVYRKDDDREEAEESMELKYETGLTSEYKRNRILFGAPGTGKSFTINSDRVELLGKDNEDDYERVTFHPDYSYANFVGTYKPVMIDDSAEVISLATEKDVLAVLTDETKSAQEKYDQLYDRFKGDGLTRLPLLLGLYTDESFKTRKADGSDAAGDNSVERNHGKAIRPYVNLLKPSSGKKDISYEYVPGPFMRMYVKALKNSRTDNIKPFLLIIEEINRANVAAVFGDIFQLLDRGDDFVSEYPIQATEDVKKYLVKELGGDPSDYNKIKIPDNMFIWATMNSADQGVFPMDTAFKRRWDFTYIGINDSDQDLQGKYVYLADDKFQKVEWNKLRKAINNFLAKEKINEDKQLGPYFISRSIVVPKDGDEINRDRFINTFKNKVIMYLFEDAAKQKRPRLFEGCFQNSSRYSEICREFEAKGVGIFNHDIQLDCEVEDVKYGDTTQE